MYIEFRLIATIGGKPFEWPVVDRFVLREDGRASERVTYFDPLPIMIATLARPSCWWGFARSGAARALVASFRKNGRKASAELDSARSRA